MSGVVESFIDGTLSISDQEELSAFFAEFMAERFGVSKISYFLLTNLHIHTQPEESIRYHALPEAFLEHYFEKNLYHCDPILRQVHRSDFCFHWAELGSNCKLSVQEIAFLDLLQRHGVKDGFSIPVFAKPGRLGHICFTNQQQAFTFTRMEMRLIQIICQEYHALYENFNCVEIKFELSPREIVIMNLVSRGKSNAAIAEKLGISPHTVDTLMRRCFQKLFATNRIEATIKALSLNLIYYTD